jgi:D-arginine dehydrogenase
MTQQVDILVIGGGIAGISAAARLSAHGETVLLERESALGYHSSGRSATFYHFGIGDSVVRGLTKASHGFFAAPPIGFSEAPLWSGKPALFIAKRGELDQFEALEREMTRFTDTITRLGPEEMLSFVPVLRVGEDHAAMGLLDTGGRKLDADALLQGYARATRRNGGRIISNAPVSSISRDGNHWTVDTPDARYSARILVNAAGAWADQLALLAGVRPLGLRPLRRTIIGFDPPAGLEVRDWPFLKTVIDDGFYMLPDAGRLLASPMDQSPSPPIDAQPEDYEMALAAWRVEEATTLSVARIAHKWAGLRSFVADKVPTAGFAPDAPGFFWLAGQGGYGLQTAPAMAAATEALMFDLPWPADLGAAGVEPSHIRPERLFS